MNYEFKTCVVPRHSTAIIRAQAAPANIPETITKLLPEVWGFVEATALERTCLNVVLYRERADDELDLEIGIQVPDGTQGSGQVVSSATPAGTVATTTHMGPYDGLPAAHTALRAWCSAQGLALGGTCWEVYGHFTPDPVRLSTEVFYLLETS